MLNYLLGRYPILIAWLKMILTMLRHLLSILILPFMVVVVVPTILLTQFSPPASIWNHPLLQVIFGGLCLIAGFTLFCWCVWLFIKVGQGTLAPWDPTTNMVAVGPYQYVRNPMISGVALILIGSAIFWGSWPLAVWAGVFILINHTYFVLSEEPGLEKRFGEGYRRYKAHVPRWIPRRTPWRG
jgi:protein-S-isoprenylcysteine O-methyltransferase Ste14